MDLKFVVFRNWRRRHFLHLWIGYHSLYMWVGGSLLYRITFPHDYLSLSKVSSKVNGSDSRHKVARRKIVGAEQSWSRVRPIERVNEWWIKWRWSGVIRWKMITIPLPFRFIPHSWGVFIKKLKILISVMILRRIVYRQLTYMNCSKLVPIPILPVSINSQSLCTVNIYLQVIKLWRKKNHENRNEIGSNKIF